MVRGNPFLELALLCIEEPPYYLVPRIAARNFTLGARAAVYRGDAVLFGAEDCGKEEKEEAGGGSGRRI